MTERNSTEYTAFEGQRSIVSGDLRSVVQVAKRVQQETEYASILIFDNQTSRQVEIDFRGNLEEVLGRLPAPSTSELPAALEETKVGRPKLGVVAREITLLPRHWEWLADQPGGASVTLRKLVEEARKNSQAKDRSRQAQEALNRFMTIMAGNFPGFEEATRSLYRGDRARFDEIIAEWPRDITHHILMLASSVEWTQP